jgi:hypothetical protein
MIIAAKLPLERTIVESSGIDPPADPEGRSGPELELPEKGKVT